MTVLTLQAYGDSDDHLRIPVLLATHLRAYAPDAAKDCLRAQNNPWEKRRRALDSLLGSVAREATQPVACLDDLDAMDPGELAGERRWNDVTFGLQRSDLVTLLLRYAEEHNLFTLRRPYPQDALSSRLASLHRSDRSPLVLEEDETEGPEAVNELPLDLRPVARWLISERMLDHLDIRELIEERIPTHLLSTAWDRLKPAAREDALRLCTYRPPMHANGALGPFAWAPAAPLPGVTVSRVGVEQLRTAGILRRTPRGDGLTMPRAIRSFVYQLATFHDPDALAQTHGTIAAALTDDGAEAMTERHHQAIAAGDEAAAIKTAQFYGSDLRGLAVQKSRAGHESMKPGGNRADALAAFEQATKIFEQILTYDPNDAYAWEYSGYNRWLPYRDAPRTAPQSVVDSVRDAYKKACQFDGINPLFRGRLIAFEAALGVPYVTELKRYSRTFYSQLGEGYLTWYFEPLLTVLTQQHRHRELEDLRALPEVRRAEQDIQRRRAARSE